MYMLDSDQEPSYNLSKILLLLPRILKLMEDMANDSTPCICKFIQYSNADYEIRNTIYWHFSLKYLSYNTINVIQIDHILCTSIYV